MACDAPNPLPSRIVRIVRLEGPRLAARDRREGGRWSRSQAIKNGVIAAIIRSLFVAADRIPRASLLALGRLVGRAAAVLLPAARRTAVENATRSLGPADSARLATRCFQHAGENLAICLLLRRPSTRALDWVVVPTASREVLARALARGRGALFVSAHLGPFEMVAAAISELGIRASVIVRESYDPRLDAWVDAHRVGRGLDVIHRGRPDAVRRIVRALRAGQPVGLLPDLGARVSSLPVQFMAQLVDFPAGPARLAKKLGSALLVGTLERSEGAPPNRPFTLRIVELMADTDAATLTQRVAGVLEQAIHRAPADWLWMATQRRAIAAASKNPLHSSAQPLAFR